MENDYSVDQSAGRQYDHVNQEPNGPNPPEISDVKDIGNICKFLNQLLKSCTASGLYLANYWITYERLQRALELERRMGGSLMPEVTRAQRLMTLQADGLLKVELAAIQRLKVVGPQDEAQEDAPAAQVDNPSPPIDKVIKIDNFLELHGVPTSPRSTP